jgi:hypothetical protein
VHVYRRNFRDILDVCNGTQVGAAVRESAGVVKVPTFQIWANGKELKDSCLASDINTVMASVSEMLDKHLEGVMDTAFKYVPIFCSCLLSSS